MWIHFRKEGDRQVICKICNREFKYSNNTSNLKDHLKRKHPEQLVPPSSSHDSNDITVQCSHSTYDRNRSDHYSNNSTRKKMLDCLFVKMVAKDMEPLRLSERKGLQEFVRALDSRYEMPSRNILSEKLLPRMYNRMKGELMELLAKVQNVAITTDMWTSSSNQGICAITCHFISSNQLRSALLEAVAVDGHHDADNLSSVSNISYNILYVFSIFMLRFLN